LFPTGRTLLLFEELEETADAIREVQSGYGRHRKPAFDLAEAHVDARRAFEGLVNESL
jgi:hypothetical protein